MWERVGFGYPSRVPSLFRRKSNDLVDDAVSAVATDETSSATRKAYTPGKGKATPKRGPAAGRRVIEAPPQNRREAMRRVRDKQRSDRAEQRAGMMAGKEEYLLPRDKGPARRLVRDIVDSRRNVGTFFFAGLFIILIGSSQAMPPAVQVGSTLLWVMLALSMLVDSVVLCRRVKRLVQERLPKNDQPFSRLYFYAVMRSINFRRMRIPGPQVKIGDKI